MKVFDSFNKDDYYVHTHMKTINGTRQVDFHGYLFGLIEALKFKVKNNWHAFIIITGNVGDGKSGLAEGLSALWEQLEERQLGFDNVVWVTEKFIEKIDRDDNFGHTVWWDEAIKGATGRKMAMTSLGEELLDGLVTKRFKKHLYILLIDDITRYSDTVIKMANAWIHVKAIGVDRGYFDSYVLPHKISYIYDWFKIHKKKSWPKDIKPDGKGKYQDYSGLFLDAEEYNKRKLEETASTKKEKINPKQLIDDYKYEILRNMRTQGLEWKSIATYFGEQKAHTLNTWYKRYEKAHGTD